MQRVPGSAVGSRLKFDQEVNIAFRRVEVCSPGGGAEHLKAQHAVSPADVCNLFLPVCDLGMHGS